MRKLIVTEYISLDGVFEEPGQWPFDFWCDEEIDKKTQASQNKNFPSGIVTLHYQPKNI